MKKIFLLFCSLALILAYGCKDDDKQLEGIDFPTEAERVQIEADFNEISLTANEIIKAEKPDFDRILELVSEYRKLEMVENAWMEECGDIVVKFEKGGYSIWNFVTPEADPPSYFDMSELAEFMNPKNKRLENKNVIYNMSKNYPGNEKAVILNLLWANWNVLDQLAYPFYYGCTGAIEKKLKSSLYPENEIPYSCVTKYSNELNLDFFKTKLKNYGVIILFTHGGYFKDKNKSYVYAMTGESISQEIDYYKLKNLDVKMWKEWEEGRVCVYNNPISHNWAITQNFYTYYYNGNNVLPNSLFYTGQCQGMRRDAAGVPWLGEALTKAGAEVVIGYDNLNNQAGYAALHLFTGLTGGLTVDSAYQKIPSSERYNDMGERGLAELLIHGDKNFILVDKKLNDIEFYKEDGYSIRENGSIETNRTITFKGKLTGIENPKKAYARLEIDGISRILEIDQYNLTFSQKMNIRKGENEILVCVWGDDKNDVPFFASEKIIIIGEFDSIDLWTQLNWNTKNDVDLHLTGPNGESCYFANKYTSWNGCLDVDYLYGEGPEHITIPELRLMGRYTLWVHYYYDYGLGASSVSVHVETQSEQKIFNGKLNATGDTWTVCYIDFTEDNHGGRIVVPSTSSLINNALPIGNLPKKNKSLQSSNQ